MYNCKSEDPRDILVNLVDCPISNYSTRYGIMDKSETFGLKKLEEFVKLYVI